jgi:diguanylate cyclase (GGDEF)-like protein
MTDLLDTIANLTYLRDKHELETMFAELIFEMVGASCLTLWSVAGAGGKTELHRRLTLPQKCGADLKNAESAECASCLETQAAFGKGAKENKASRHVFPINDETKLTGLIEIIRPTRMSPQQEAMVTKLIRVYGNHAGVLDYGDRDELTGLLNRRGFNSSFKLALQGGRGHAIIAVADIDFFKRINDEFGHVYGDEVLILLGRLMEACLGERDGVFRFGGEEFLVILQDCVLDEAAVRLEAFRAAVHAAVFPQVGRVTISIGFATIRGSDTGASAFGRADEALYVAKQRGRNQVQCYEWLVEDGTLREEKKTGGQIEIF